jgi:hypothetical protein
MEYVWYCGAIILYCSIVCTVAIRQYEWCNNLVLLDRVLNASKQNRLKLKKLRQGGLEHATYALQLPRLVAPFVPLFEQHQVVPTSILY